MFFVVFLLDAAASVRFLYGGAHGVRHIVRIHHNMSFRITGGTAHRLYEGGLGTQEAFLVRIQNGNEGNLRDVQALPQQVDAHQDIENIQTHVADNLRTLQGVDVRM